MNRRTDPIRRTGLVIALGLVVLGAVLIAGCTGEDGFRSILAPAPTSTYNSTLPDGVTVTKLEVFHFHVTHQCRSCRILGDYANATVTTYFADELESGKVVFRHINLQVDENREIVKRYGARSSSLWLGAYTSDGEFHPLEDPRGLYGSDDEQRFMDYFRVVIERRLAGDLAPD